MVLWEHDKTIERWKCYYGKLLNEETPGTVYTDGVPNERTEMTAKWKGYGTRRNSCGGVEKLGRRMCRYFFVSLT